VWRPCGTCASVEDGELKAYNIGYMAVKITIFLYSKYYLILSVALSSSIIIM
jgi:hypothetical protein